MIRIKHVKPLEEYLLNIVFEDGKEVIYNVKKDIDTLPGYDSLRLIKGLFQQVQLDKSRTCIFWNSEIDLPSDTLYEYGKTVPNNKADLVAK